jgi:hypothetical protein
MISRNSRLIFIRVWFGNSNEIGLSVPQCSACLRLSHEAELILILETLSPEPQPHIGAKVFVVTGLDPHSFWVVNTIFPGRDAK